MGFFHRPVSWLFQAPASGRSRRSGEAGFRDFFVFEFICLKSKVNFMSWFSKFLVSSTGSLGFSPRLSVILQMKGLCCNSSAAWQVSPSHSAPKSAEVSWYVAFGVKVHVEFILGLKIDLEKFTFWSQEWRWMVQILPDFKDLGDF